MFPSRCLLLGCWFASTVFLVQTATGAEAAPRLRVAAAAVDLEADDSMVIGGSILPKFAAGQEGKLRALAVLVQDGAETTVAVVACDVLMMQRDVLDAACRQIEQRCGIPANNVLINATHTHHAPTTCTVHGYKREEAFTAQVGRAVVEAVCQAAEQLKTAEPATLAFRLGEESTVGHNSRLLLSDGMIAWSGAKDDVVRPTGPFDPELPVLAFRGPSGRLIALVFNHSTHTMGVRSPGKRSPSFYGLAAQELEEALGAPVQFLEGASGSTHNQTVPTAEAVVRIKLAVRDALSKAVPLSAHPVASIKREIDFRVRHFDEAAEDQAVRSYCLKRLSDGRNTPETTIEVFRRMRSELASQQGQARKTWVQAIRLGDVALVGVPGEYFTSLGVEIKRRSPFRYTYVAELANDWIGYIPDREAYKLGGYQVWTGLHSYVEQGTGEKIVDETVDMLRQLHAGKTAAE